MLMRLDLALMTEAAGRMAAREVVGLVGEEIEDTETPSVIYILIKISGVYKKGLSRLLVPCL